GRIDLVAEHGDGTLLARIGNEAVPVGLRALQRRKEVTGPHGAAVGRDARHVELGGARIEIQVAAEITETQVSSPASWGLPRQPALRRAGWPRNPAPAVRESAHTSPGGSPANSRRPAARPASARCGRRSGPRRAPPPRRRWRSRSGRE